MLRTLLFWLFSMLCLFWSASSLRAQVSPPLHQAYSFQDYNYREGALWRAGDSLSSHTAVKPWLRRPVALDSLVRPAFAGDSWFVRKLFSEPLIAYASAKAYAVQIDPLFDFGLGRVAQPGRSTFVNTRGLRLQGTIGTKIAFHSSFYENQAIMPAYIDSFVRNNRIYSLNDSTPFMPGVGIIPGQGIAREFAQGRGWDYSNATAYISYSPLPVLNFQLGQDRHFIGHGYRSMLLSDLSYPAPFFKLQARLGPLQYSYILMQLMDPGAEPVGLPQPRWDRGFRRKYASFGYLNWQLNSRFQLGFMQAVVFPGDNPAGGTLAPSWQFLNPLLFFHPTNYGSGSEANLLLGFNSELRFANGYALYGQFILDELVLSDFLQQNGSARNKFGLQLGLKAHDLLGISRLFFQLEYNAARPYTYSHTDRMTSYTHYLQPLAHPLGANFHELLLHLDYRLSDRVYLRYKAIYHQQGQNFDSVNVGSDPFANYQPELERRGLSIGWGASSSLWHQELALGYLLNPHSNMKLEFRFLQRYAYTREAVSPTTWLSLAFRTDLRNIYYDF